MKTGWLYEISFIRPILLVLLVSYHAFAPFCGAWELPTGIEPNYIYKWIALFSRAFRLEAFVFVSGYIFAMQVIQKKKFTSLKQLMYSKFIRLIIPCWIFGLIYWALFRTAHPVKILTGIGHLWYLPCLFWCFLLFFFLYKGKFKGTYVFIALVILCGLSFIPLPFQLNRAMYYMLFFYIGGEFWKHTAEIKQYANIKNIIIGSIVFFTLLISVNIYMEFNLSIFNDIGYVEKAFYLTSNNLLKAILAFVGILTLFLIASIYTRNHSLGKWIIDIGVLGYGVYIFHQFILRWMYYNTALSDTLSGGLLPWVGLVTALLLSSLLTILLRKFEIGRKLL